MAKPTSGNHYRIVTTIESVENGHRSRVHFSNGESYLSEKGMRFVPNTYDQQCSVWIVGGNVRSITPMCHEVNPVTWARLEACGIGEGGALGAHLAGQRGVFKEWFAFEVDREIARREKCTDTIHS